MSESVSEGGFESEEAGAPCLRAERARRDSRNFDRLCSKKKIASISRFSAESSSERPFGDSSAISGVAHSGTDGDAESPDWSDAWSSESQRSSRNESQNDGSFMADCCR